MKIALFSILLISCLSLHAEEQKPSKISEIIDNSTTFIKNTTEAVKKPVVNTLNTSVSVRHRNNMAFYIHHSPIDIILPGKWGASFYYSGDDRLVQYEVQYLKSSLSVPFVVDNLGGIDETRISILKRSFWENSNFNWYYGLSYNSSRVHLGNEYLSSLSPADRQKPEIDLLLIDTLGFDLGWGSRWYFNNNITLGVDWVGWSQPVFALKKQNYFSDASNNNDDKSVTDRFINVATYLPRFSFLKLSLGYSF